jgi:hypothetical protein
MRGRVARWCIFKPKILIWVNFGRSWNEKGWYMYYIAIWNVLRSFGTFFGHLVTLRQFGIFSPFWYIVSSKIWQH